MNHLTRQALSIDQLRTVRVIEAIGFGVIEHLRIRQGCPCYESEPSVVQTIKLGSPQEPQSDSDRTGGALKKEFQELFEQLNRIGEGVVDIEVRHGAPFRLAVEWPGAAFCDRPHSSPEKRR